MKLNIQLFAGSVSIGTITETTDINTNQSTFTIPATMTTTGATYNNDNAYMTLQWKYASSSSWASLSKQTFGIGQNSSKTKSWTLTLDHNSDGTLENINFRVKWYITDSTNGTTSATTKTPTTIPRASEITSVYATPIPSNPNLTFTPKSSSFKYMVRYKYNNLTYQSSLISPNTTSPYTYSGLQIPIDVFSGVSSSSITITAYLYTYDANNNPITPTATKTFSVALTSDAKPTITIDHLSEADTTMISKNWGIYVQGKSKLSFRVITSYSEIQAPNITTTATTNGETFSFNGYTYKIFTTQMFLSSSGSKTISVTATDSRGRSATTSQSYNVIAYSNPTINTAQVQRCDANGNVDKNGQYCLISYNASISSCDNHNKAGAEYKVGYRVHNTGSYTYVPLGTNANSKSASGILFTDGIKSASSSGTKVQFSDSTYDIQFYVKDSFTTITNTQSLDSGFDLLNFNPSGKAMAIGKVSEAGANEELLEIALPTKVTGNGTMVLLENNTSANATQITTKRNDTNVQIYFGIGSGGYNRGIFDITEGRWLFMYNGTDAYVNEDKVGNALKDTGWIKATLNEGYTHSALASAGDFMYRRIGNVVYTKGSVKGFTAVDDSCTQLPSGFRPATRIDFCGAESGNYIVKLRVGADGNISYLGGTRGSIANTQWVNICTSYVTDQPFPS